jgi:hypothetical protein
MFYPVLWSVKPALLSSGRLAKIHAYFTGQNSELVPFSSPGRTRALAKAHFPSGDLQANFFPPKHPRIYDEHRVWLTPPKLEKNLLTPCFAKLALASVFKARPRVRAFKGSISLDYNCLDVVWLSRPRLGHVTQNIKKIFVLSLWAFVVLLQPTLNSKQFTFS